MKMDRRSRKTKESIKNAMISLMEKKTISGITVKAICEAADINRSTFYAHYTDQFALLAQLERECVDELTSKVQKLREGPHGKHQGYNTMLAMLTFIADNPKLCLTAIFVRSDMSIFNEILDFHQKLVFQLLQEELSVDSQLSKYISIYTTNAVSCVILDWLKTGMQMPIPKLAQFLETMIGQGTDGVVNNRKEKNNL